MSSSAKDTKGYAPRSSPSQGKSRCASPAPGDFLNSTDRFASELALHWTFLVRFALKELRDPVAAEDAVQETLAAALATSGSFVGRSGVRTWLIGILKHKILDEFRRRRRESSVIASPAEHDEARELDPEEIEPADSRLASQADCDPEYAMARRRFWDAFGEHLDRMPARTARAFAMHAIDGRDATEVCGELGITPANLWVMLHRARKTLRASFAGEWQQYFVPQR
jgi:RNA polymerase sigma-70 factor (ECF subfamily)